MQEQLMNNFFSLYCIDLLALSTSVGALTYYALCLVTCVHYTF